MIKRRHKLLNETQLIKAVFREKLALVEDLDGVFTLAERDLLTEQEKSTIDRDIREMVSKVWILLEL